MEISTPVAESVDAALPDWAVKLGRRVAGLPPGRYTLLLTVTKGQKDWTVTSLGKVETTSE